MSRLDGIPASSSPLLRAHQVAVALGALGFDWPDVPAVLAKVDEERVELGEALAAGSLTRAREELGDLLLACMNLARHLGEPADALVAAANAKFERRFRQLEHLSARDGIPVERAGPDQLDSWWREAKRCEDPGAP